MIYPEIFFRCWTRFSMFIKTMKDCENTLIIGLYSPCIWGWVGDFIQKTYEAQLSERRWTYLMYTHLWTLSSEHFFFCLVFYLCSFALNCQHKTWWPCSHVFENVPKIIFCFSRNKKICPFKWEKSTWLDFKAINTSVLICFCKARDSSFWGTEKISPDILVHLHVRAEWQYVEYIWDENEFLCTTELVIHYTMLPTWIFSLPVYVFSVISKKLKR